VVFIATARDVRRPEAEPLLVGSVEASTHEFTEVGFSPCLSETRTAREEEEEDEEDGEVGEVGDDGYCFYSRVSRSNRASSSLPSSSSSSTHKKKSSKLYITGMMVSEAFRRQGVAASLLRAIDTHASQNQINYICLYVEGSNESALKLYENSGFNLVAFSPQAEAFASAIGLYKGPFSARQYSFAYKRLKVEAAVGSSDGVAEEKRKEKENAAWPGRVPVGARRDLSQQQQQQQQQRQNPLTLTAPTWWFTSKGVGGGEGKEQQQQQQQQQHQEGEEKSLLSEPTKPFPARLPSLISPF
jgi:ribosomal protein S18 acetylase RimI-like enzyme